MIALENTNYIIKNGNFIGIQKPPSVVNGSSYLPNSGGGVYSVNDLYSATLNGIGTISRNGLTDHIDIGNSKSWVSLDVDVFNLVNGGSSTRTSLVYNYASGTPALFSGGAGRYLTLNSTKIYKDFSIEIWFRPESGGSSQPLFFSGNTPSTSGYASLRLITGTSFGFYGRNSTSNFSATVTPGTSSIYHHYVVTHESSSSLFTVYRDVTTTSTTYDNYYINPGGYTEYVGYDPSGPGTNFLSGYLAVFRKYDRALTLGEIQGNFNNQRQRFGV